MTLSRRSALLGILAAPLAPTHQRNLVDYRLAMSDADIEFVCSHVDPVYLAGQMNEATYRVLKQMRSDQFRPL